VRRLLVLAAFLLLVAVAAGALAPGALADNGGFTLIEPNSPNAEGIESLFWFVSVFALLIFLLVEVVLILFVVRYRRRRRDRFDDGANVHGSTQLELLWTAAPVVILALIAGFVFFKLSDITDPPEAQAAGDDELAISVVGRQFSWQYEYPNGVVSIDTLRVPTGVPIRLELTAPDEDVIHSWWIPALQGKRDVIPGSPQTLWFRADREGSFVGQCTELCGAEHAKMTTITEAVAPSEFDAWLEGRRAEQDAGDSPLGEEEWEGVCAKCHGLGGEGGIGPRIAGSPTLSDAEALERIVREGRGDMPPVGSHWTDDQVEALTSYLRESPPSGQ
jgi:cytochrome c oxidase subunit II